MAVAHLSSATLVTIKVSPPSSQHGDLRFGRAEPGPFGISRPAPVTGQRPRTPENSRRSRHSEDVAAGQGLYRRWLLKPSAQPTLVRNPTPATAEIPGQGPFARSRSGNLGSGAPHRRLARFVPVCTGQRGVLTAEMFRGGAILHRRAGARVRAAPACRRAGDVDRGIGAELSRPGIDLTDVERRDLKYANLRQHSPGRFRPERPLPMS